MKLIFFIFFLSLFTNLANANDEDWIFLRCVKSSDNIKYFEVSVSREMMIERNGYQFTFTRLTPFLIQFFIHYLLFELTKHYCLWVYLHPLILHER